jgi:hypothetical protein
MRTVRTRHRRLENSVHQVALKCFMLHVHVDDKESKCVILGGESGCWSSKIGMSKSRDRKFPRFNLRRMCRLNANSN